MPAVTILAIRPHPDDECTGTGGITCHYVALGVPVGVLTCTMGEEGEILDPDLDPDEARPRLAEIRERELRAACQVLGVSELRLLRYRDSGMQDTESTKRPDAFCNQPLDEAGARVADVIRELRPRVVVTENQFGTYGHPDHVMCHKVSVRGVELAADSSFRSAHEPWTVDRLYANEIVFEGRERIREMLAAENIDPGFFRDTGEVNDMAKLALKPEEADVAVDVGDCIPRMREALRQHRTQIPADSFFLTWPDHIASEIFRTAYLRQLWPARSPSQPHRRLSDLLEGLPDR